MKTKLLTLLIVCFISSVTLAQEKEKNDSKIKSSSQNQGLEKYKGSYFSSDTPDGVVIYVNGNTLMSKIPGQPSLPLVLFSKNIYKSEKAGLVFEFKPSENKMVMKQGEKAYTYTRT